MSFPGLHSVENENIWAVIRRFRCCLFDLSPGPPAHHRRLAGDLQGSEHSALIGAWISGGGAAGRCTGTFLAGRLPFGSPAAWKSRRGITLSPRAGFVSARPSDLYRVVPQIPGPGLVET